MHVCPCHGLYNVRKHRRLMVDSQGLRLGCPMYWLLRCGLSGVGVYYGLGLSLNIFSHVASIIVKCTHLHTSQPCRVLRMPRPHNALRQRAVTQLSFQHYLHLHINQSQQLPQTIRRYVPVFPFKDVKSLGLATSPDTPHQPTITTPPAHYLNHFHQHPQLPQAPAS